MQWTRKTKRKKLTRGKHSALKLRFYYGAFLNKKTLFITKRVERSGILQKTSRTGINENKSGIIGTVTRMDAMGFRSVAFMEREAGAKPVLERL
jgi:hypothetical protein